MIKSLVDMYERGAITSYHLVAECLHMIDPEDPGLVLNAVPKELLIQVHEYARQYQIHGMTTNYGILPTIDQIEAVLKWVELHNPAAAHGIASEVERDESPSSHVR